MEFSYGKGIYLEGSKHIEGEIILGDYKLYLRGTKGDLAQTYIPLDKIKRIFKKGKSIHLHVHPSISFQYVAIIQGEKKLMLDLLKDVVQKRGLKKKFLCNEWIEESL